MDDMFGRALTSLVSQGPLGVFIVTLLGVVYTMIRSLNDRNSKPSNEAISQQGYPPWVIDKVLEELRGIAHELRRNNDLLRDLVQRVEAIRNDCLFRPDRR